ncbi:hypothetical protein NIES4071_26810 [Calothrix sp. NIES-4071]|nr:hypothetical protein NIES4071_26810 [Calothrix sp. NIES-4071]BAZ57003.1 hypothetical protein NIES4105_26750 [Calothrix sp. NIES-4105]
MMSSIKRFSAGAIIGLVIAASYWSSTTLYFHYQLTLSRGILGCSALSIICGLITLKWGYEALKILLDNSSQ